MSAVLFLIYWEHKSSSRFENSIRTIWAHLSDIYLFAKGFNKNCRIRKEFDEINSIIYVLSLKLKNKVA